MPPPDEAGGPGHAVMIEAKKAVDKDHSDEQRVLVLAELKTSKSLVQVANHPNLKIWNAGGSDPKNKKINARVKSIVGNLSEAQEGVVRTAVTDALEADRNVRYQCAIEDVFKVRDVHFHIHVDPKVTTIEICPDAHI